MKKNSKKEAFLKSLPENLIEDKIKEIKENILFSFQYFDNSQTAGQDFKDWSHEQLEKLLNKLKIYSKESLEYWKKQKIGSGKNHILEIYKKFPVNSEFTHPKHIPIDVEWARFRLEGDMRLIGFVINNEMIYKHSLEKNKFYVVFLDAFHKFYKPN